MSQGSSKELVKVLDLAPGFSAKLDDLNILISDLNPSVIALQKSLCFKSHSFFPPLHFLSYLCCKCSPCIWRRNYLISNIAKWSAFVRFEEPRRCPFRLSIVCLLLPVLIFVSTMHVLEGSQLLHSGTREF